MAEGLGVTEGSGVGEGIGVGEGFEVVKGDGLDIGCGVLRMIELLRVVIKPALSCIWQ